MPLKKLSLLLWVVIATLVGIYFATSTDSGYREYPATVVVAPPSPAERSPVSAPRQVLDPVASPARPIAEAPIGSPVAAVPSSKVMDLLAAAGPASAPPTPLADSSPARRAPATEAPTKTPDTSAGPSQSWRIASSVSKDEIDAAIQREAMTAETAVAFRSACQHDHDLKFDAAGNPLYACAMKIQVGPDTTAITATPSYPLANTFLLHSRPTATRKIYLDFDGHTTTGTPWNGTLTTFTTPPFSRDTLPAFNDAEKAIVQESFRRIAEHFAAWDVDVTTEDPGVEGLRKTSGGDVRYGIRVVIGPKAFDISAAGVAYVGSFDDGIDNPCFVFASSSWTAALIAGVTSHEVGHTVSLLHQGQTPGDGEYFGGHGTGALSWSPIMGNGLRPINQWAKGEYKDASRTQDNIVAITSMVPLVADDHGGTTATATLAPGVSLTGGGVITDAADVDMIKFKSGRGNLVITSKVALTNPNLRLQIQVLNAAGTVLGTFEGDGTSGKMAPGPINLVLAEGDHFIRLDGIGNGPSPQGVNEGYTDYGSVGFYSLTASWADPGNKPPVADASATTPLSYDYATSPGPVSFNGLLSTDPDGIITNYSWNFNDRYPATGSGGTTTHRYKAPGVYRPVLTVADDRGATGSTQLTITVTGPTIPPSCSLASGAGTFVRVNSIHDAAAASMVVQDQYGNPLRGALVYVAISGMVKSPRTILKTDVNGGVSLRSPVFKRGARGSVRFDVTTVQSSTHPYSAIDNDVPAFLTITR